MQKQLFDKTGRFSGTVKSEVVAPNKKFYFTQPTKITFSASNKKLIEKVKKSPCANILKGVCLPVTLPKIDKQDYGTLLAKQFLPTVEKAYTKAFLDRTFTNWRKGELANQVTVVDSRHRALIQRMQEESVEALYFPAALQGFSVHAAREAVAQLPEGFSLAGAIDTAVAIAQYPKVLARDLNTPVMDCGAVQWQDPGYSLFFCADDAELEFHDRGLGAREDCSGGVFLW